MSRLLSKLRLKRKIRGTMVKFNGAGLLQSVSADVVLVHTGLREVKNQPS